MKLDTFDKGRGQRWALLIAVLVTAPAAGEPVQSLAAIEKTARDFVAAQHATANGPVEVQLNPLDPHLRLVPCGTRLEAFMPNGARALGNTTVGVRCPGSQPWTIYLKASVRTFADVIVAARFVARGATLTAADLKTERRDLAGLMEFETDPSRLLGKQARRPLSMGMVVSPRAVIERPLIRQGERVTLRARRNGMEVNSSGVALRDGALGQRLAVRNESSQRVVEGTVVGDHQVEVE